MECSSTFSAGTRHNRSLRGIVIMGVGLGNDGGGGMVRVRVLVWCRGCWWGCGAGGGVVGDC